MKTKRMGRPPSRDDISEKEIEKKFKKALQTIRKTRPPTDWDRELTWNSSMSSFVE